MMAAYLPGFEPEEEVADSHDGSGDRWMTPGYIRRALLRCFPRGYVDPCGDPCSPVTLASSAHLDIRTGEDGLTMRWPSGAAFVNPPYSNASEWIRRCFGQAVTGSDPVIALLPFRAEGRAWHQYVWGQAQVVLPLGRIKFLAIDGHTYGAAQIGTAFVCWNFAADQLARALRAEGLACVVLDVVA